MSRTALLSLVLLSLVGCDSGPADDLGEQATDVWTIAMPDEFMPLAVRDGTMLGFFRDDLNVERVATYRIQR